MINFFLTNKSDKILSTTFFSAQKLKNILLHRFVLKAIQLYHFNKRILKS